jgi:hypothetical protein
LKSRGQEARQSKAIRALRPFANLSDSANSKYGGAHTAQDIGSTPRHKPAVKGAVPVMAVMPVHVFYPLQEGGR